MSSRADAWQRRALIFGAALDGAFALAMLVAPSPASRLLRLQLPPDRTWFTLCGVLLLILAGVYLAASRAEPGTRRAVAAVAGFGRLLGGIVLVQSGLAAPAAALWATGVLDALVGIAHLGLAMAGARPGPRTP